MFKRILLLLPVLFLVAACQETYLDGAAPARPVCEFAPNGVEATIGNLHYLNSVWYANITYTDQNVSRSKQVAVTKVQDVAKDALEDDASIGFTGCLSQAANTPADLVPTGQTAFVDKVYVWVEEHNGFSERFVEVRLTYGATSVRWVTVNPANWDDWKTGNVLKRGNQLTATPKGEQTL